MSRGRALPFVLDVLDQGLWLYRRHLRGFALVAVTLLTVLALGAMGVSTLIRTTLGDSAEWTLLAFFLALALAYPLLLYVFAALSRAANTALQNRPITLRESLRLTPGRGCVMVLVNAVFAFISALAASALGVAFSCPLIFGVAWIGGWLGTVILSDGALTSVVFFSIAQVSSLWSMTVSGAWLAGLVFALQPFALATGSLRAATGQLAGLINGGIGRSLLMFLGAGAIFGTLTVIYTGSLIMLLVILAENVEINLPAAAGDAIVIALVVGSLALLLPPLAIWMTIFHRRLTHEREGIDLVARIDAWRAETVREPARV